MERPCRRRLCGALPQKKVKRPSLCKRARYCFSSVEIISTATNLSVITLMRTAAPLSHPIYMPPPNIKKRSLPVTTPSVLKRQSTHHHPSPSIRDNMNLKPIYALENGGESCKCFEWWERFLGCAPASAQSIWLTLNRALSSIFLKSPERLQSRHFKLYTRTS